MVKSVAIIVRDSPFNTIKSVEAFRFGVGLTLEGNRVEMLLMGDGVWNALTVIPKQLERPDVGQFIQSMELCGITGYVEAESLPPPYLSRVRAEFKKRTTNELCEIIQRAEVVIPF